MTVTSTPFSLTLAKPWMVLSVGTKYGEMIITSLLPASMTSRIGGIIVCDSSTPSLVALFGES